MIVRLFTSLLKKSSKTSIQVAIKTLISTISKKWQNAKRTHDIFVKYNDEWLGTSFCFVGDNECAPNDDGSFRDSSDRTKRRRTEEIREKYSHEELGFATQMSLRAEGKSNAAKVIKDVILGSPSKATRYRKSFEKQGEKLFSNDEALALLIDNNLSKNELDSESSLNLWSPTTPSNDLFIEKWKNDEDHPNISDTKRTYSREEFLHEAAATGGPNIGMRLRYKDRIKEKREDLASRKRYNGESKVIPLISTLCGQQDDEYQLGKNRSPSIGSNSSIQSDNELLRSHLERRNSSPYILNNSGMLKASLTIPVQTQNISHPYTVDEEIPFIEEVDNVKQQFTIGMLKAANGSPKKRNSSISESDSSVSSSFQATTGIMSYDSAVGSSFAISSPFQNTRISSPTVDQTIYSLPSSWTSSPPTSPDMNKIPINYIPDDVHCNMYQEANKKTLYTETSLNVVSTHEPIKNETLSPSISNIGHAVLKSKTQDFENLIKGKTVNNKYIDQEKKKYTKRRYTDSRHQTRHIPDAEDLEISSRNDTNQTGQSGAVYKRRELISSVPNN
ncbi:unnamed protein product [Brassicogethes aeneus]|uniref:Uncharacterized protein n=1 Tax=Brassicogethes aeneus TaxID=1431903 RepID=A0A9P0FMB3_BRAAE|nr:unnamed protein product [Brassicogethes aeneus]